MSMNVDLDYLDKIDQLLPMEQPEIDKIKGQIIRRWTSKSFYNDFDPRGPDEHDSPSCMMRAHEVIRMIKFTEGVRDENVRLRKALDKISKPLDASVADLAIHARKALEFVDA